MHLRDWGKKKQWKSLDEERLKFVEALFGSMWNSSAAPCVILQATRFLIYLLFAFSLAFHVQWSSSYTAAGAERMWVFDSVKASQCPVAACDLDRHYFQPGLRCETASNGHGKINAAVKNALSFFGGPILN